MLEQISGRPIELAKLARQRLKRLSAVVQVTEPSKSFDADLVRRTSARVVGQPPAVRGPNQVVGEDHVLSPERIVPACVSRSPDNGASAITLRARNASMDSAIPITS